MPTQWLNGEGWYITLHPNKTVTVDATKESFNFLGFTITTKFNPKTGKRFPLIIPSAKAEANLRERVKSLTQRNKTALPTEVVTKQVNVVVRGWVNYFYVQNCSTSMRKMSRFLEQRMRIYLRRKHRVRSFGYKRFPDSLLYENISLYKIPNDAPWKHNKWMLAKKVIGKPCTGKLYARFDEGELEKYFYGIRLLSTLLT